MGSPRRPVGSLLNTYDAGSAREVMAKVFQLFANEDIGFLERFAAQKHGRKRRYLAKDRLELYPGRKDLADYSVEIVRGCRCISFQTA